MKILAKKAVPSFPEHWKKPEDAPIKRHDIVKKLVAATEKAKDNEYIRKFPMILYFRNVNSFVDVNIYNW